MLRVCGGQFYDLTFYAGLVLALSYKEDQGEATPAISLNYILIIHSIGTCVPRFDIKNLISIVSMVNYETLAMQCHAEIFILCVTRPM